MAQEKRARRGFLVLFSIFSLNGVMACQSESDSSTEAVRVTAGQTACFDKFGKQIPCKVSPIAPLPVPGSGYGATCRGVKDKAFAQATGSSEYSARAFLERELENKLAGAELKMDDFEIRCTNPNGRAATYVQCSAYERFATRDNWETKTILSTTAAQGFYRDENAKDYLEQLLQEMKAKGVVFRNQSIAPVLPRDLSARDSDSGKVIWKLTYEVPGC